MSGGVVERETGLTGYDPQLGMSVATLADLGRGSTRSTREPRCFDCERERTGSSSQPNPRRSAQAAAGQSLRRG